MSYSRFFRDVESVCLKVVFENADKSTERALCKNLTLILNYYKLIYPILFTDETISAKVTFDDTNVGHIQLVMSSGLESEYTKYKGR